MKENVNKSHPKIFFFNLLNKQINYFNTPLNPNNIRLTSKFQNMSTISSSLHKFMSTCNTIINQFGNFMCNLYTCTPALIYKTHTYMYNHT